jgi:uncharacterized CHY-type Zn-finger protein
MNQSRCAECNQELTPASGPILSSKGQDYHPQCFKCGFCGQQITGAYGEREGKRACGNCGGARRQGFVVDPRTGQKKPVTVKPPVAKK